MKCVCGCGCALIRSRHAMKIHEKIEQAQEEGRTFFSFEYFAPKTDKGVTNLFDRFDRMAAFRPEWIDVTWGAGGSTSTKTLKICQVAQRYCGLETMMHLTLAGQSREDLHAALCAAKESGVRNILALRGDAPRGQTWTPGENGFYWAADFVKYIKAEFGDQFSVCVAGYPEKHPVADHDDDTELSYLKAKVDAGADFIISQFFYDVEKFVAWVKKCRNIGITVPILPGIMPIQSFAGFKRMTGMCKVAVPEDVIKALEPIESDDAAVKEYGVKHGIDMCKKLLDAGLPGLHFYTLNLEKSVVRILDGLELITKESVALRRPFPWKPSACLSRSNETVRPIYWNNRPRSYMSRTESWDEFPNGRWGDARSPAWGDLEDTHYATSSIKDAALIKMWGEHPTTVRDIEKVFVSYLQGKIARLPWNHTPLSPESSMIHDKLVTLNNNGFLTINSQPKVNGAPSSDGAVGWGGKGGFVYQKAYLEFFASPDSTEKLLALLPKYSSLTYQCVNVKGDYRYTGGVNALTWGVFPGKEVIQPTVADPESFLVWKDEAFSLWKAEWGSLYREESDSRKLIDGIHDSWYIVNVVENNFVTGNIFAIFDELIESGSA